MAIIKHVTSKNMSYNDVLDYFTYKHREDPERGSYEPILDEYGLLQERESCAIVCLDPYGRDADPRKWSLNCLKTNGRFGKNREKTDRKQHQYILSHPEEDRPKMTMEDLLEEGKAFARENLQGYDVLIAVHRDTELGDQKTAEKKNLKLQATSVQRDLTQKAQECYQAIETDVGKIIDDMEPRGRMDTSDKQALIQETVGKIEEKIRDRMHIFAERIISELNTSIQQEREKLSFELVGQGLDRINAPLNNIKLNDSKMSAGASVVPIVTDTMLATFTPVFGIGGAIEGFRAAGLKGGIAGGLSGCAISYAGLVLAVTLGAAALPAVVLGAAAGAFGGKAVTKALFKDEIARKSLEALQKDLRQQVSASLTQMRLSAKLETWIRNEVSSRYGDLIRTMENECDSIIAETNRKILAISQTLTASEAERKAQRQDLKNLEEEAAALMKNLEPVYRKILAVPEPTAV